MTVKWKQPNISDLGIFSWMPFIFKHKSTTRNINLRARLHQASPSTLRQLCDDACDSVVIEINGIAPEWVCNPFSSDPTVFHENRIVSVIAALKLTLGINGPLACHWNNLTVGCNHLTLLSMVLVQKYNARGVLVSLIFCKIWVSTRFCGVCARSFFMLLHCNCLVKLHFLWRLNSKFVYIHMKNVQISGKQAHPCRKILNDFFKALFVIITIPSLHYPACRDPLSEDFLYYYATVIQLDCAATERRLN